MLLFCCYTPAHEILYREVFVPSVPEGFEVRATQVGIDGPGDYLSGEFLRCIRAKLDLVVASIEENQGQVIVWSDVDVRFFDLTPDRLGVQALSSSRDILFQRESPRMPDVNTGFFVCHCTPAVLEFFRAVRAELDRHPEENEQMVVNRLLSSVGGTVGGQTGSGGECGVSWGYLPLTFYARTHGWPPPRQLAIYHANYTKGADAIGQKLSQFAEIERIVAGGFCAWAWSVLRRIPGKLSRPS